MFVKKQTHPKKIDDMRNLLNSKRWTLFNIVTLKLVGYPKDNIHYMELNILHIIKYNMADPQKIRGLKVSLYKRLF